MDVPAVNCKRHSIVCQCLRPSLLSPQAQAGSIRGVLHLAFPASERVPGARVSTGRVLGPMATITQQARDASRSGPPRRAPSSQTEAGSPHRPRGTTSP